MANVLTSWLGRLSTDTTPVTHPGRGQCVRHRRPDWKPAVQKVLAKQCRGLVRKHISPAQAQGSPGCTKTGFPHALVRACTHSLASLPSAAGRTKPYVQYPLTSSHLPFLSSSSQRPLQQDTAREKMKASGQQESCQDISH